MLEEYLLTNIIRGTFLLWSIFSKTSTNPSCLALLVQSGLTHLVAQSLNTSNSLLLSKNVLTTLTNICEEKNLFSIEREPMIVESLLAMIEKSNQDNLLMIIRVLSSMRIESADGSNYDRSMKMINKVLMKGVDASNSIKFTILKVMDKLFTEESKGIGTQENCSHMLSLIQSALEHGTMEVKEIASNLCLKMIATRSIEIVQSPEILAKIMENCCLKEVNMFDLRQKSIEILYRMAISVKYLNLIILNSHQVLETVRTALENMHPEIASILKQIDKFKIRQEEIAGLKVGEYMSVHEDDLISIDERQAGLELFNDSSMNDTKEKGRKNEMVKRAKRKNKKARSVGSIDTEMFFQDRSDVFSDFSDDDQIPVLPQDIGKGEEEEENIVGEDIKDKRLIQLNIDRAKEVNESTFRLVKVLTVMLSCDFIYSKIFGYNFHAMLSAILEKSIDQRVTKY